MALKTGSTFSLTLPSPLHSSSLPSPSLTFLFKFKPTSFKCLLCSPTPIFLPLLEQNQLKEQDEKSIKIEKEIVLEDEEEELDPIRAFFKFRSQTQKDPKQEGRLSLQRSRRTTWHLAESESEPLQKIQSFDDPGDELGQLTTDGVGSESVVEEILKISRNLPQNSTLGDYLDSFVGKVSKDECVKALIRLGEEGLIWSCLYLFEWMGLQEPLLTTPRACVVIFTVLAAAGMGEKLMVLFENLPRAKEFRDVRIYNAAISGLAVNKRYDDAWRVYGALETDNIMPDHVTCCILITVMRKSGRCVKDAWEFFERMNRKGVNLSLEVFGALIKSFCDEGLKKEALIIQSEMEKKGIPSNAIIYSTLMNAYVKCKRVEEAEALFVEMKEKGLEPSVATYNILMDAYARRMQTRDPLKIYSWKCKIQG